MIYKQIFPTRWPLFDFHLSIWKLDIATMALRTSMECLAYEYVALVIRWNGDEKFRFRIYDTERRQRERLDGMLVETKDMTIKRLKKIRKIALEEMRKINHAKTK